MISHLDPNILDIILGSMNTIDIPKMSIQSREEAIEFVFNYGYDISNYKDSEILWRTHRRAIEILEEEILDVEEELPPKVRNREELKDISDLLLMASYGDGSGLQRYACAILRVMHIIIQLENDLFTSFTDDIQYQLLRPIQEHIFKGEKDTYYLGEEKDIPLKAFSVKPFKQTKSAVIKLLAKDNVLAMTLLDRVGVRFITKTKYDIFRVIRYLVAHNVISVPHTLSGQSKNLICPPEIFTSVEENFISSEESKMDSEAFDIALEEKLVEWQKGGNELETKNKFTSKEFRFIKFISRRFLKIDRGPNKDPLTLFYPFEVQLVDEKTHEANESTNASHIAYKERQRRSARRRVLGIKSKDVSV